MSNFIPRNFKRWRGGIETVSAASKLLGRGTSGAGAVQEITLGTNLSMSGTTLNASGGGGGGPWVLADSWTYASDIANKDFTGLSGYSEILVNIVAVTLSVSGVRRVLVSTDNGSTFLTTSGDYMGTTDAGVTTANTGINVHVTSATAARSGQVIIRGFNVATANKPMVRPNRTDVPTGYIPTATALNAIRVDGSAGGNLTGGSIYIWGRA